VSLALLLPKMKKIPVFHRRRKVDWLGGVLLMASAVIVMLVLTWGGNRFAWASPAILAMVGSDFSQCRVRLACTAGARTVPADSALVRTGGPVRNGRGRLRDRHDDRPHGAYAALL
jgi:hypothetical protein